MFHGNRRPLRARRLRPGVAFLGIALAAAIPFVAFQPEELENGAEEGTWIESPEEMVAIHHLDRFFRVDAGLEPALAGDGRWSGVGESGK
jgi:hypothetical protein